jgi:hypothetical protein
MANAILEILGLSFLPASEAESVLRKILDDSYVLKVAQELSLDAFKVQAVQKIASHPLSRGALIKRVGATAGMQSAVDLNSIDGIVAEVKGVAIPAIFLPT